MQLLAVFIAAALVLIALAPLARGHFRQPTFWMLLGIGVFAFPIAQWVNRAVWEPLAVARGIPQGGFGLVVALFVWALLGEVFKFAPVLIVGALTEAKPRDWFAFGAAAGAGFALFAAQQVIGFALEISRLPLGSPANAALAIALRLFPILAHIGTTAFVAWGTTRGWLYWGLFLAAAAQTLLGLVERWQTSMGALLGGLLFALIASFIFLYVWTLRDRRVSGPSRQPAG